MKLGIRSIAGLAGALLGAALLSPVAQAQTFTYSLYLAPSAPGSVGVQAFNKALKKKTDGDIQFKLYYSGTLSSGKTTLRAIKNGLVDGGGLVTVYTPSSLPANMVISDMAFYNEDVRVTAAAATDTIMNDCPQCLAEYRRYNVHFLASMATAPYHAMCKGQFKNGFNAEGLRMRTPGGELGRWIETIGAIPVQFENSEAYQALQRNALDCAEGSLVWLDTLSWQEVVDTVVNLPMGGYQGGSLINISQRAWAGLDESAQRALEEAAMYGTAGMVYDFVNRTREVVKKAREKYGVQFIDAPASMVAKRKQFMETEIEEAVEKARERGVKQPLKIAKAFKANLKKWEGILGDKELTQEQYAKLLIEHLL